uniref:Uncharacterized protein n=1 Tax=Arundo donax TaxID=35708 RepID=A0A0A9EDA6_ARUDO
MGSNGGRRAEPEVLQHKGSDGLHLAPHSFALDWLGR